MDQAVPDWRGRLVNFVVLSMCPRTVSDLFTLISLLRGKRPKRCMVVAQSHESSLSFRPSLFASHEAQRGRANQSRVVLVATNTFIFPAKRRILPISRHVTNRVRNGTRVWFHCCLPIISQAPRHLANTSLHQSVTAFCWPDMTDPIKGICRAARHGKKAVVTPTAFSNVFHASFLKEIPSAAYSLRPVT